MMGKMKMRGELKSEFLLGHPRRLFRMPIGDFKDSPDSVILCVRNLVVAVRTYLRYL